MKAFLAVTLVLSLQAAPLDDYYKFKTGATWTYKRLEGDAERKIVGQATGEVGGAVRWDWNEYDKDGILKEYSILTWSVTDGVLAVDARKEGEAPMISFALLKQDAKKDDKWPSPGGEMVHLGKADVTVPAGTYKDATWTQFKSADDAKVDFYLVPKVGLVKIQIHGDAANRFELVEFKDAKK